MNNEVRLPDLEILITATNFDVAFFVFYANANIHDGYDVLVGIRTPSEIPFVRTALQDALAALSRGNWSAVDVFDDETGEKGEGAPF